MDRRAGRAFSERHRGALDYRLGELDFHDSGREVMLDGLEGTDGLAELTAVLRIVGRLFEHRVGNANKLRCGDQRGMVEQRVGRADLDAGWSNGCIKAAQRVDAVKQVGAAIVFGEQ